MDIDFEHQYDYFKHCLDLTRETIQWPDSLYKVIKHTPSDEHYFTRMGSSWLYLPNLFENVSNYISERNLPELTNEHWAKILNEVSKDGSSLYASNNRHTLYHVQTPELPWSDLANDVTYINMLHDFAMDHIEESIKNELLDSKHYRPAIPPLLSSILKDKCAFNLYELINNRPDLESYLPRELQTFVALVRNMDDPHIFDFIMHHHGHDTSRIVTNATEAGLFGDMPLYSTCGSLEAYKKATTFRTARIHAFTKKLNAYRITYEKRTILPKDDSDASRDIRLRCARRFNRAHSYENEHKLVLLGLVSNFKTYKDKNEWRRHLAKEALTAPLSNSKIQYTFFDVVQPTLDILVDNDYRYHDNIQRLAPLFNSIDLTMMSSSAIDWFRALYLNLNADDKKHFLTDLIDSSLNTINNHLQKHNTLNGFHIVHSLLEYLDFQTRRDIILRLASLNRPDNSYSLEDLYISVFDTHELVGHIEEDTWLDLTYVHMKRWLPELDHDIHCARILGLRLDTFIHTVEATALDKNGSILEEDKAVELPTFEF